MLLLDEPLGALDKNLRESMQFELRQLQQTLGITTVLVTHDQEEALTMSDQVAVMRDGRLVQFGPPSEVYHRPVSRFVAEFLGASNVMEATKLRHADDRLEARLVRGGATIETLASAQQSTGDRLEIAVRPESISVSMAPLEGMNSFAAVVTGHVFRGTHHAVQVELAQGGQELLAYVPPRDVLPGNSIPVARSGCAGGHRMPWCSAGNPKAKTSCESRVSIKAQAVAPCADSSVPPEHPHPRVKRLGAGSLPLPRERLKARGE